MPINDLLPWNRSGNKISVRHSNEPEDDLLRMQTRMNRLFDEFFENPFGFSTMRSINADMGSFVPQVDVSETDDEIKVVAEIPGLNEKDVQVSLSDGVLTITGQKENEKEEKNRRYHRIERTSGSFRRDIPLPGVVNEDKVEAVFENGVLTIKLPKLAENNSKTKRITVQAK